MSHDILVLVHPGSACGSADSNMGKCDARVARDALTWELDHWNGPVVVIHGDLSDELSCYPHLHRAIEGVMARARARAHNHSSDAILGDDGSSYNQKAAIQDWVAAHVAPTDRPTFLVTGAWHYAVDGACVDSVVERLQALGYTARVSDSALEIDEDTADEDEDEDEDEATRPIEPEDITRGHSPGDPPKKPVIPGPRRPGGRR